MKNKNSYSEMLRQENELTKLKLQAEFGMQLNEEKILNPAIENLWLKNILEFERSMANNTKITIVELLGNPVLKPVEELNDDQLLEELQSVMELLNNKNIVIDSICQIDDREMYRFITQELIKQETDSNIPKNMMTCYIYEEFHPNHDHDIREHLNDFMESLTGKENNRYEELMTNPKEEEKNVYSQNLKRRLKLFRDAFDEIHIEEFNIISIDRMDELTATINFDYKLAVLPPDGKTMHFISGNGIFTMDNQWDYWIVDDVVMKGVV